LNEESPTTAGAIDAVIEDLKKAIAEDG